MIRIYILKFKINTERFNSPKRTFESVLKKEQRLSLPLFNSNKHLHVV